MSHYLTNPELKQEMLRSFKLILIFLSFISDAISKRYLELKLIIRSDEAYFALIISLPSPEFVLFTDNCT